MAWRRYTWEFDYLKEYYLAVIARQHTEIHLGNYFN